MNTFGIILIVAVVTFLIQYLVKSSRNVPVIDNRGKMILRLNRAFEIIGYTCILMTAVIIIIACLGTVKSQSDLTIVICLGAFSSIIGVILILYYRNFRVEVDEEKLTGYGIFGKSKEIQWGDIKNLNITEASMELVIMNDTVKIKIYPYLIGFPSLIDRIKQKLDVSKYQEVLKQIELINNKF